MGLHSDEHAEDHLSTCNICVDYPTACLWHACSSAVGNCTASRNKGTDRYVFEESVLYMLYANTRCFSARVACVYGRHMYTLRQHIMPSCGGDRNPQSACVKIVYIIVVQDSLQH